MIRIWPALAVVFVIGLAAAAPAFGAFPGENGKIAFYSDRRGGDFDIWTMDPDGTLNELQRVLRRSHAGHVRSQSLVGI